MEIIVLDICCPFSAFKSPSHEKSIFLKLRSFFSFGLHEYKYNNESFAFSLAKSIYQRYGQRDERDGDLRKGRLYSSRISIPAERNLSRRFHLKWI